MMGGAAILPEPWLVYHTVTLSLKESFTSSALNQQPLAEPAV